MHFFKISQHSLELEFSQPVGGITGLCAISEKTIATGHWDKTITLWNVEGKHMEKIYEFRTDEIPFRLISLPNSTLTWKNATTIYFWNFCDEFSQPVRTTTIPSHINHLENFPEAKKLVVATSDGKVYLLDYENFDDHVLRANLSMENKNLFRVHIISDILWVFVFQYEVVFYDPEERLFTLLPPC
jgi:WD40 repeat protein